MKPILLLLFAAFSACNGSESTADASGDSSIASSDSPAMAPDSLRLMSDTVKLAGPWYLLPVLASDTGAGRIPQLHFKTSDKTFTGNTGCNSMSGTFQYTDSTLQFNERIMLTKMACTGYNEAAFIKNLLRTDHYRFEDTVLVLMAGDQEISRWSRHPTKPPVSNKV
jgi:heat shock protein HslJ